MDTMLAAKLVLSLELNYITRTTKLITLQKTKGVKKNQDES